MKIKLIVIGKVKEQYYRDMIAGAVADISGRTPIEIVELPDESIPVNAGDRVMEEIKQREGKRILDNITSRDYVIALCIEGKMTDNEELAGVFEKAEAAGKENIVMVIGGSLGLHESVTARADYRLSFSRMTFPHQLMRAMLLFVISDIV